jgi:hypothetical protein
MLTLKCRIKVRTLKDRQVSGITIPKGKKFTFSEVKTIETNQSVDNFTGTASFSYPKGMKIRYTDIEGNLLRLPIEHVFGTGDAIKLETWCEVPIINSINPAQAIEKNSKKNYKATFTGYITRVQIGKEIVFECEDQMYLFKRNTRLYPDDFITGRKIAGKVIDAKPIQISTLGSSPRAGSTITAEDTTDGATLGDVSELDEIRKATGVEQVLSVFFENVLYQTTDYDKSFRPIEDVKFSKIDLPGYRSEGEISLVQFFDDLKKYTSAYTFFREGKLYIGLQSWPEFQNVISNFAFQQNIIDGGDLKFQREDEIKYRVEITNIKDGKQTKLANGRLEYFGDADGEVKQWFLYNFDTKQKDQLKQLQDIATSAVARFKYTGFTGSFTTFGVPVVQHGDFINLYDPDDANLERNGQYLVMGVKRIFDASSASYRQTITLGIKV